LIGASMKFRNKSSSMWYTGIYRPIYKLAESYTQSIVSWIIANLSFMLTLLHKLSA